METAKIVNKERQYCHDCQKKIEINGKEIKNGVFLAYDNGGEKIMVLKCHGCYQKSQELRNF